MRISGLEHVPTTGRILIVANHPTGFVDALAILSAVGDIRSDLYYVTHRNVCRVLPRTREFIIPIEWLRHRRTRAAMRETLASSRAVFGKECAIVIFPAGSVARVTFSD